MRGEYITEAIVLGTKPYHDLDKVVDFYTKDLGRVEGRVISARKILSKFSPHLNLPNLVKVRLVKKGNFTVTDVVTEDCFDRLRKNTKAFRYFLELFFLLRALLPVGSPDLRLWHYLVKSLNKGLVDFRIFLKILGYDPIHAQCEICGDKKTAFFYIGDQSFLCNKCSVKFPEKELIYIYTLREKYVVRRIGKTNLQPSS